jgi:hypothetical protein
MWKACRSHVLIVLLLVPTRRVHTTWCVDRLQSSGHMLRERARRPATAYYSPLGCYTVKQTLTSACAAPPSLQQKHVSLQLIYKGSKKQRTTYYEMHAWSALMYSKNAWWLIYSKKGESLNFVWLRITHSNSKSQPSIILTLEHTEMCWSWD